MRLCAIAAASVIVVASGCSTREPIYRWGVYENLVYEMYANPAESDPGAHVALLSEDIERTHAEGKRVPPGVHAHLGFLYYSQGQVDAAHEQFVFEKELFPESETFIDGILERMAGQ
jgi:hypothetical protein